MLGLDVLAGGSLLLMAQGSLCQIPKPADISVIPSSQPVKYDTSQTIAQIQAQDIDTINPFSFNDQSYTSGYMKGNIAMEASASVGHYQVQGMDAYCLYYDQVRIDIAIDPTIVIPREVAADRCKLASVQNHELKHVRVDKKIVNKYARVMGQKVYNGLAARGFTAGPFTAAQVPQIEERMRKTVGQIVELEYQKMKIERAEAQQAVDSLAEYQRMSAECPN